MADSVRNKATLLMGLKIINHVAAQRDIFSKSAFSVSAATNGLYNYIEASVICKKTYVGANISYSVIHVN